MAKLKRIIGFRQYYDGSYYTLNEDGSCECHEPSSVYDGTPFTTTWSKSCVDGSGIFEEEEKTVETNNDVNSSDDHDIIYVADVGNNKVYSYYRKEKYKFHDDAVFTSQKEAEDYLNNIKLVEQVQKKRQDTKEVSKLPKTIYFVEEVDEYRSIASVSSNSIVEEDSLTYDDGEYIYPKENCFNTYEEALEYCEKLKKQTDTSITEESSSEVVEETQVNSESEVESLLYNIANLLATNGFIITPSVKSQELDTLIDSNFKILEKIVSCAKQDLQNAQARMKCIEKLLNSRK